MFILDFIRKCKGYVRFTAEGVFVERFLNLASKNHISVWDGKKSGGIYTGCTDTKSYKLLRKHAKKAGVRIRVIEKCGAPFKKHKYRKRKGLLIGLAIFAAFLIVMSRFIWRIQVNGTGEIPESTIIQALESIGITPGVLLSSIDVRDSERRALLLLHDVSWIALNIEGSTVHVEYNPSDLPPPMIDPGTPCNIVAAESGHIITFNVYEGQALVQKGDTVVKGDIIVSGITRDRQNQSMFKHARALVIARTMREIEIEIPFNQTEYKETGETRSRTYISLLGFDLPLFIPLKIPAPYRVERSVTPVAIFSASLPFSILREDYILMREETVSLTKEQARKQALLELEAMEKAELEDAEIYEKTTAVETTEDMYILKVSYDCAIDIAKKQEILVEGTPPA